MSAAPPRPTPSVTERVGADCGWRWSHYCGGMYLAVKAVADTGKAVLVVTQPYYNWEHEEQQARMVPFLRARFAGNPRVRFADLGHTVNLKDRDICYDGLHLNATGNRRIADALLPYAAEMLK